MANVNSNGFTVIFATIACVVSGVLLSSANLGLKEMQAENEKVDKQKSVLLAAGLSKPDDTKETIAAWFTGEEAKIQAFVIDTKTGEKTDEKTVEELLKLPDARMEVKEGKKVTKIYQVIYESSVEGSESYILPVVGDGLWGKMHGYLAVGTDGYSIKGICFYNHKETPGLGAEITEKWFTDQFISAQGKKLLKSSGDFSDESFVGIDVLKGVKVADQPAYIQPHAVDGISGATITSVGLKDMLQGYVRDTYRAFLNGQKS